MPRKEPSTTSNSVKPWHPTRHHPFPARRTSQVRICRHRSVAFEPALRRPGRSRTAGSSPSVDRGNLLIADRLGGGGYALLLLQQRWQEQESRQALPQEPPAPLAEHPSSSADSARRQTKESPPVTPSRAAPEEPVTPSTADRRRSGRRSSTNRTSARQPASCLGTIRDRTAPDLNSRAAVRWVAFFWLRRNAI